MNYRIRNLMTVLGWVKSMRYLLIILAIISSCTTRFAKDRNEIIELINSTDLNSQMKGIFMVGETRDSSLVKYLFHNADDPRVSTHLNFQGMSLYQQKMWAMEKITNIAPPHEINKPDSTVMLFYEAIARERGWIE